MCSLLHGISRPSLAAPRFKGPCFWKIWCVFKTKYTKRKNGDFLPQLCLWRLAGTSWILRMRDCSWIIWTVMTVLLKKIFVLLFAWSHRKRNFWHQNAPLVLLTFCQNMNILSKYCLILIAESYSLLSLWVEWFLIFCKIHWSCFLVYSK